LDALKTLKKTTHTARVLSAATDTCRAERVATGFQPRVSLKHGLNPKTMVNAFVDTVRKLLRLDSMQWSLDTGKTQTKKTLSQLIKSNLQHFLPGMAALNGHQQARPLRDRAGAWRVAAADSNPSCAAKARWLSRGLRRGICASPAEWCARPR
jgi:hypothetical protein